jgi:hypothetical protein
MVLIPVVFWSARMPARASSAATDWYLSSGGGTYSWAGGSSALIGTNLAMQYVLGNGTQSNNGQSLSITDGLMNFTSGAYNGTVGSTWSWGPGGTFSVTGCIAGVTTTSACTGSNNVTLLSDDFESISIVGIGGSDYDIEFGQIEGTVNSAMAQYFGLSSTTFSMSNFITVSDSTASPGTAFTGNNLGGMIDAVADPPVAAAENWGFSDSLALFAAALLAFGVLTRLGVLRPVQS